MGDSVLYTGGLDECVGVAILNPYAHVGHLGHFTDLQEQATDFDAMLDSATNSSHDRSVLEIWARGAAIFKIPETGDTIQWGDIDLVHMSKRVG